MFLTMPPVKDKWVRRFVITETDRHKRGFTIYKVTSVMFLKTSPENVSKVSVWKRYSDFRKLHTALSTLYSTLESKEQFPSFPKSRFFGRFETEVIEERKDCALRLLAFIAKHPALYSSDMFVKFFESSHLGGHLLDCSQSLSTDTSEDDRVLSENPVRLQRSFRNSQSLAKGFSKFICIEQARPAVSRNHLKAQNFEKGEIPTSTENERNQYSKNNYNQKNKSNGVVYAQEAIKQEVTIIHDGSDLPKTVSDSTQYILIAAAHMSAAFRHEAIAEYEEAFTQYKLGISNLMNGIQSDSDAERKATIKDKIRKYLQRAEKLYNRHLNCNISELSKPLSELENYKVLGLIESVMIVKDALRGFTRIIKTIEMPEGFNYNISNYILRGKVPYMVQLHACIQTDSTVFLVLQNIRRGKLWDFIKSHYKPNKGSHSFKKVHRRSFSCDAVIQPEHEKECDNSSCSKEKRKCENLESDKEEEEEEEEEEEAKAKNEIAFEIKVISDYSETLDKLERTSDSSQNDIHTTQLVVKAQKLLQSVNATLKKSNSIATRLNESQQLHYNTESAITNLRVSSKISESPKLIEESEQNSCNLEDLELKKELDFSRSKSPILSDVGTLKFYLSTMAGSENFKHECEGVLQIYGNVKDKLAIEQSIFSDKLETEMEVECVEGEQEALWKVPEDLLQLWAAQILVALESLHQQDAIVADLRPDNILINDDGSAVMTYVARRHDLDLLKFKEPYSSPELCSFAPSLTATTAVDIWSFGILLYELLTGFKFQSKHSGEFHSHSTINIPGEMSEDARSLLLSILKYQPSERLRIPEIKRHPFFAKVDWLNLLNC